MGRIVEQSIPTLFGGVSRQPASVRRPNQVQDMENALASVVTGGFEKRPATQTLAWLNYLTSNTTYAVHDIDRDATEQIFLMVNSEGISAVNALTGAQITVNIGDTKRYYLVEQIDIDSTGVIQIGGANMSQFTQFASAETTFDWGYSQTDGTAVFKVEGSIDGVTWNDIATGKTGTSGTFSTTIGAAATGDHNYLRVNMTTAAGTAADHLTLWATFADTTYLASADPDDFRFSTVADFTFLVNRLVTTRMAEADSGSITASYQTFTDLETAVTPSGTGNVYRIIGDDTDAFGTYYVIDSTTTNLFEETVDPTAHNNFDTSSMPHLLTRESDGTFTYAAAAWVARGAGDETLVEDPPFIGTQVQDVTFYRNRLAIAADEHIYAGKEGEVFTMWPDKALEVLDTDPVERAATSNDINILKFVTVFRKIMFATSERAQFELTSQNAFTPQSALFDLATSYAASPIAAPEAIGDVLYFPAKTESHAIFYEYFFNEATLSNTAADISKHIVDYIPNDVLSITGDPATNTLFVLTTGEQNSLFVYRSFFDAGQKLQSSWSKYTFGATEADAFIHGIAVMSGFLVLIIERQDGGIYLEQMPIERESQNAVVGFTPFFDQREVVTGTYSATPDCTHWDLTYEHNDDAQIILGPSHTEPGRQPGAFYPDRYALTLASVAAGETIVIDGLTFTAHATTTTTANREFSISGNDAADATELTTVLNDATDGMTTATATNLGSGVVQIDIDDKCQAAGTLATPTGTAVTNATVTVTELKDVVAAKGDLSAASVWVGRPYTMSVTLSELFARTREEAAILTGRLQLKDISFLVSDTGYLEVQIIPAARDTKSFKFEGKVLGEETTLIGAASIAETAVVRAPIWVKSDKVDIKVLNDQPVPCIVESAAWRGFFNEISRQE